MAESVNIEECKYQIGQIVVFGGNTMREIVDIEEVVSLRTMDRHYKICFKDGVVMEEVQVDRLLKR